MKEKKNASSFMTEGKKKRQNRRGTKMNSQTINGHTKSKETGNKPTDDEKKHTQRTTQPFIFYY